MLLLPHQWILTSTGPVSHRGDAQDPAIEGTLLSEKFGGAPITAGPWMPARGVNDVGYVGRPAPLRASSHSEAIHIPPRFAVDFPARAFYPLNVLSSMSRQRTSECLLPDRGRSGLQPHGCGRQGPCDLNLPGDRPATASPSAP